jgi:hypothetical protein
MLAAVLAGACMLAGCSKQMLRAPVVANGGAWWMEVAKLKDGPDSYNYQMVNYVPARGTRFLWVVLRLSNTTEQDRRFNWASCDLDAQGALILPSLIAVDTAVNILKPEEEVIRAGDTVGRRVAFSFPKGELPTRLHCKTFDIPLDLH